MFENKFNSKKVDPLVEAAKSAMELGQLRRDVIAAVNEEFGVYSRNAVVREHLAAYDARVEEAYKCAMKEEDKNNPAGIQSLLNPNSEWRKKADADPNNPFNDPNPNPVNTAPSLMTKEELAKHDYDRDGRRESPKKEVWGSRLRAAKASGKYRGPVDEKKMWEGSGVSGEDPGMEVAKQAGARQQAQTPPSTPARTGNAAGDTLSKAVREDTLDEVSKGSAIRSYAASQDYDNEHPKGEKIHAHIVRKFGKKAGEHAERHADASNFGRTSIGKRKDTGKDDSIANDRRFQKDRLTKTGKVHKQDTSTLKGNIKRRLGSHTKANLPEGYELDEAKYSAKAARHGEDIGKPGKMFSKIAARSGGGEKGERIAGAILKKIRAKHMKEGDEDYARLADNKPMKLGDTAAMDAVKKSGNPPLGSVADPKGLGVAVNSVSQGKLNDMLDKVKLPSNDEMDSRVRTKQQGTTPTQASMNESVQVGTNKYRIV